jgi:hypothetical protein
LAESLGIFPGNVQITGVGFEVKAVYMVFGVTAQEWSAASVSFADVMQQELGFPVNVTGVSDATGSGGRRRRRLQQTSGSRQVSFTVQGFKDIGSGLSTVAKIVEIAAAVDTATSGDRGSSKSRLVDALTSSKGQGVQVS